MDSYSISLLNSAADTSGGGKKNKGQGTPAATGGLAATFEQVVRKVTLQIDGNLSKAAIKSDLTSVAQRTELGAPSDRQDYTAQDRFGRERYNDRTRTDTRSQRRADAHRVDRADARDRTVDAPSTESRGDTRVDSTSEQQTRRDDAPRQDDRGSDNRGDQGQTKGSDQGNQDRGDQTASNQGADQRTEQGQDGQAKVASGATSSQAAAATRQAEQVLSSIIGAAQATVNTSQATVQTTDAEQGAEVETAGEIGDAIDMAFGQTQTAGRAAQHVLGAAADRNGQAQANANGQGQAQMQTEAQADGQAATATGPGETATRQAEALSRMVGQGNKVAVDVEVNTEQAATGSRTTSSLSASNLIANEESGPSLRQQQGSNGSTALHVDAAVQQQAQQGAPQGQQVGQATQNQGMATAAVDAKAGVHGGAQGNQGTQGSTMTGEAHAQGGPGGSSETNQTQQSAASRAMQQSRPLQQQQVVDQVSVQITKAMNLGADKIHIQLKPADLGRVDVRMDVGHDGKIMAVVTADNKDTLEMLKRDAGELAKSLQDAGLQADAGSMQFNLRGQKGQQSDEEGRSAGSTLAARESEEVEDLSMATRLAGYQGGIRADGRVDIRA